MKVLLKECRTIFGNPKLGTRFLRELPPTHTQPLEYPFRNPIDTLTDPFREPKKGPESSENYPKAGPRPKAYAA